MCVEAVALPAWSAELSGAVVCVEAVALPAWSAELIRQLRVGPDRDWRTFAEELGFGPELIVGFATASDPCWSTLQEWYRAYEEIKTETTEDASQEVIHALYRMKRPDLVAIIEDVHRRNGKRDAASDGLRNHIM